MRPSGSGCSFGGNEYLRAVYDDGSPQVVRSKAAQIGGTTWWSGPGLVAQYVKPRARRWSQSGGYEQLARKASTASSTSLLDRLGYLAYAEPGTAVAKIRSRCGSTVPLMNSPASSRSRWKPRTTLDRSCAQGS